MSLQTRSKPIEHRQLIKVLSVMRHHSRGSFYSLLFPYFKSPRLASSQQTLKSSLRVCTYAGTLFSEECNITVRLNALYVTHRS